MKERLDILLVERGFFPTREKAKRAIMAGNVIVNEQKVDKAGAIIKLDNDPVIRIKGDICPYVSRGGYKLEKAIKVFNLDFSDKIVLDIGASTGGFTDCALQNGGKFVYAVDVGSNQLDYKLRVDSRVKSLENKHIKDLTSEDLDGSKIDLMVMDVSFISITKVIPSLIKYFNSDTKLMALIKPQFEVGKENIDKGGIVRDYSKHIYAIKEIIKSADENNLVLSDLDFSPIKGGKGNVEYISILKLKNAQECNVSDEKIKEIVELGKTLGGEV